MVGFLHVKTFFSQGTILLILCCLCSCQNDRGGDADKKTRENRAVSFSEKLEIPSGNKVELTPKAKEKVSKWPAFLTAKTEVGNMKGFTVRDAMENAENLGKTMNALETTLPKELLIKPILARIAVLKSLTGMLEQLAASPGTNANEINDLAVKIPLAFENLKIQLNEAYRKGLEEFQAELETEKKPVLSPVMKSPKIIQKSNQ